MALRFEWDAGKASANFRKHGVSRQEASTSFADPVSITIADPDHSIAEERYLLIGASVRRRLLVVSHTEQADTIRIISARTAARTERKIYDEEL